MQPNKPRNDGEFKLTFKKLDWLNSNPEKEKQKDRMLTKKMKIE